MPYKDKKVRAAKQKIRSAEWYKKNKKEFIKKVKVNTLRYRELAQGFVLKYLMSNPCKDCGETDPIVLEFDHVRGKKVASVCNMSVSGGCSLVKIKKEIDKCEVVCANCHRKRTAKRANYYRYTNAPVAQ